MKGPGPFIYRRTTTETFAFPTAMLDPSSKRKVCFRYNGIPARRKLSFDPRDIVTDANNQIILTDYSTCNNCLHILDQNGQFLKCVDGYGPQYPKGLGLDSKGRLWVGTKSSYLKIIEYIAHE